MPTIEDACYWFSTVEQLRSSQPLAGDLEVDVCIVGAGFTGLWTAHFLTKLDPRLSIAIVEQGFAGYGASGRNAGMVSPCLDHSHALAITHFGEKEASRLAAIGKRNFYELADYAQDCDFEANGTLYVALNDEQKQANAEGLAVAVELGLTGYELLSAEQVRAQLNSPLYLGALQCDYGGILNPQKLVRKLKNEAASGGVRVYEATKVTDVQPGIVVTAGGKVRARRIVLATDAYTHHLFPGLLWRFIPLYDYILVSRPLTPDELASLGWQRRQGVTDGRAFFNYYRLTADNRILWGTSEAVYYPGNKVDEQCDHSEHHYRTLKESFQRHFPQLAALEFPFAWGGPIAATTRLTPFFGSMHDGHTVYGLGYTGHGIATTRLAGTILAHMALSQNSDLLKLKMVTNKPFPYPPEPLRRLAVNAVTRGLQTVDAGGQPNLLLKMLDALGIGFSS